MSGSSGSETKVSVSVAAGPSSTDAVRTLWGAFADQYRDHYEPALTGVGRSMANALKLQHATSVIEAGAGPGLLASELARLFSTRTTPPRFVVTDLAPEMVTIARARLTDYKFAEVSVADSQALSFKSDSFDRYIANLSLMIVPDADAMLREAARVLKPGGLAAFSIWGDEDKSAFATILPKVSAELKIGVPPVLSSLPASTSSVSSAASSSSSSSSSSSATAAAASASASDDATASVPAAAAAPKAHSYFHLYREGIAALKERFQRAGFTGRFSVARQFAIMEALSSSDYVEYIAFASPPAQKMLSDATVEQRVALKTRVQAEAQAWLDSGRTIGLDTLVIFAEKRIVSAADL